MPRPPPDTPGREIVAIADHPYALRQRGFDYRFDELYASGIKHQHFRFIGNHFVAYRSNIQHQTS